MRRSLVAILPFVAVLVLALLLVATAMSISAIASQRSYIERYLDRAGCVAERREALDIAVANASLALADVVEGKQPRSFRPGVEAALLDMARADVDCGPVVRP